MHRATLIPTLAIIAAIASPFAAQASAADDLNLQFHGFASQGYLRTHERDSFDRETEHGSFEFNEFALNVVARPIERVRVGVQIIAYDLGKYGNDEPQIDWAFGEYQVPTGMTWLDTSLVAGRFKTGHGFYNDFRDVDMTRTSVFLPSPAYSATFRDFFLATNGGQINATLRAGALGSFDISGFVGTQNIDETDGPILDIFKQGIAQVSPVIPGLGTITLELESLSSMVLDRMSGGYFTWNTPLSGLRLKVSSLYSKDLRGNGGILRSTLPAALGGASDTTDIDIWVYHWFDIMTGFEYQTGNLTLAGECSSQYWKAQIDTGAFDYPALPFPPFSVDTPASRQMLTARNLSAYVSANYQLSDLPGAWSRFHVFGAGNWARNVFSGNRTYIRSGAVAVRYDITDHFLIKAEFQRYQDTNATNARTYGNVFALKTTFDF